MQVQPPDNERDQKKWRKGATNDAVEDLENKLFTQQ
jgi:hypothetical protein